MHDNHLTKMTFDMVMVCIMLIKSSHISYLLFLPNFYNSIIIDNDKLINYRYCEICILQLTTDFFAYCMKIDLQIIW